MKNLDNFVLSLVMCKIDYFMIVGKECF